MNDEEREEWDMVPTFGNPVMEALATHGLDYWDLALFGLDTFVALELYLGGSVEEIPPQIVRYLAKRGYDTDALAAAYRAWCVELDKKRKEDRRIHRRARREAKKQPATA